MPSSASGGATGVRSRARMHGPHCRSRRWCVQIRLAGPAWQFARGSWRVVPLVKPASTLLKRAWISQGRPAEGKVCPARYSKSSSGMVALSYPQSRVHEQWETLGLQPIGLHEARHTAATWLDHAGVSPKVASQIMGHTTPDYQPGAAAITLRRYTHTLPGELERGPATCWISSSRVGPEQTPARDLVGVSSQPAFRSSFSALRISLRFRSLRRSPERFAPLYAGDFGLSGAGSKTVVGGFVHRGFESHPLRFPVAQRGPTRVCRGRCRISFPRGSPGTKGPHPSLPTGRSMGPLGPRSICRPGASAIARGFGD
jgi:hypothetical protein